MGRRRLAWLGALLALAGGLLALDRSFPPELGRYRAVSAEIDGESGELLGAAVSADGALRLATRPDQVDPHYLDLLLRIEDRRFYWHPGVDPLAIARAFWQLASRGRVISGGSTLTMQVARLLHPHRHDLLGKLHDTARALQLEAHFSKGEILAMYVTLAPFGGNVEGVRAASQRYFATDPASLTQAQAALLVALPQSPTRLRPDRHPEAALRAEGKILARAGAEALPRMLPLAASPAPWPRSAMHLVARRQAIGGPERTSLDAGLQHSLEALAHRESVWLGGKANIAILAVRNRDRAIIGYVGGADYFGPGGMVDMTRAIRSPGSTLKPFIYGMALADSLVVPETLIEDRPIRFGDYAPRDFDGTFRGEVTVRQALQQSLNLPAVELLDAVGPARFLAALRQTGTAVTLPKGAAMATLPIALGGAGTSLQDLVKLYAGLASGGMVAPLRLAADAPSEPGSRLLDQMAAAEIGDILRGAAPPDGISLRRSRPVAFKTGTSYGFRDAWSVGYSPSYTIGVWVGRADGTPRPGAFGRETAAPLLFKAFDMLPEDDRAPAPPASGPLRKMARLSPGLIRFLPRHNWNFLLAERPSIVFPPSGATLEISRDQTRPIPIALEASGGRPPYRWAVNGLPLAPEPEGVTPSWKPEGVGFARISVTDANNETVAEEIRLQ